MFESLLFSKERRNMGFNSVPEVIQEMKFFFIILVGG